jgi:hypothetical protein
MIVIKNRANLARQLQTTRTTSRDDCFRKKKSIPLPPFYLDLQPSTYYTPIQPTIPCRFPQPIVGTCP